jgi:hypothetical protein
MTTRRDFLAANLIAAAGLATNPARMLATPLEPGESDATSQPIRSDRDFWVDWPEYLTTAMNQARSRRMADLAAMRSVKDIQERITMIRSNLWNLMGGMPTRTPLNAKITRTSDRGQYKVENIVFESFPKVYVTANLYLPV